MSRQDTGYSRTDVLAGYAFLVPALLVMIVFVFWPVLSAFRLSFHSWSALNPEDIRFVGFRNYAALLHDDEFHIALWNTAVYTLWVVPVQTFFSLVLAAILNQRLLGRDFFRTAFHAASR